MSTVPLLFQVTTPLKTGEPLSVVVPVVFNAPAPVKLVPPKMTAPLAVRLPAPPSEPPVRLKTEFASSDEFCARASEPPVIATVLMFAPPPGLVTVRLLADSAVLMVMVLGPLPRSMMASAFAVGVPRSQLPPMFQLLAPVAM